MGDRHVRAAAAKSVPQVQFVTFRLGAEEFGFDVFGVHEILRYQPVTPVPKAPDFVEGVIDVRGTLVPVVDLRRRFELPNPAIDGDTRIVLVEFGGERLGLIVDAVTEVLRVPSTSLTEPPPFFRGLAAEFIRGIVRAAERLIVVIDVAQVLSSDERIALEAAEMRPRGGDDAGATTEPGTA